MSGTGREVAGTNEMVMVSVGCALILQPSLEGGRWEERAALTRDYCHISSVIITSELAVASFDLIASSFMNKIVIRNTLITPIIDY